jgi:hypothetical protein
MSDSHAKFDVTDIGSALDRYIEEVSTTIIDTLRAANQPEPVSLANALMQTYRGQKTRLLQTFPGPVTVKPDGGCAVSKDEIETGRIFELKYPFEVHRYTDDGEEDFIDKVSDSLRATATYDRATRRWTCSEEDNKVVSVDQGK